MKTQITIIFADTNFSVSSSFGTDAKVSKEDRQKMAAIHKDGGL